jgi:lysyl-tRNA synthetase class 1
MGTAPQTSSEPGLWPHEEARRLVERVAKDDPSRAVVFESGFGPSGLPHLGTMCEVLRPAYVRHAFRLLAPERATRLIVFIDDMDGLRKVPDNVPNREEMTLHLGKPVSRIPDPFGCCSSYSEHMIGQLVKFLEPVEVDYELPSSSAMYGSGAFDSALRLILAKHAEITAIIAPTLREENRAGWSPIMPLCPSCGQINATRVTAYHPERATVEFSCERSFGGLGGGSHGCGFKGEQSVLGGLAKAQWKVDWALRWFVLGVDYELYGKDLIDSARLSSKIVSMLGGKPPLGFHFEFFLEAGGGRVSKSKGTQGVSVDQWQRYAPIEVLKYFLMLNPKRARKLFLESIPQYADEYLNDLRAYANAEPGSDTRRNSPLEFVLQSSSIRRFNSELSFGMIMHLVSALGTSDRSLIWNYLKGYDPRIDGDSETRALAESLVDCAINFYEDFVEPGKQRYTPSDGEREQLKALAEYLTANPEASAEEIEKTIYELGRTHYDKPGKIFPLMYRTIMGQERGPRLGAFIRLATPARVAQIIEGALVQG